MAVSVQIKGKLNAIFETKQFGNYFEKRVFWVEDLEQKTNPNIWELELQQGDCTLLDKFHQGQTVLCEVVIKGKSNTGKDRVVRVFNALVCTMIKKID